MSALLLSVNTGLTEGKNMLDLFIGVACTLAIVAASWIVDANTIGEAGYITYEQQEQGKEQCERNIKRSEHCVPDIIWLPVVSDLAE